MPQNSITYWLWRGIGRLAFNRVAVVGRALLPLHGPVLFVATHRNGALDAAPYAVAAPLAIPVVSAQLHRLPLGRWLFRGIAVARAKDKLRGIQADNAKAMEACVDILKRGEQLFIMPEGTSTLGPRHLPFHRGAARIVGDAIQAGVIPTIVPLGIHYEDPTIWQSRVEVLVGKPIQPQTSDTSSLHRLISHGLEAVAADFPDADTQRMAENLAYACTLGTDASYARTLKFFEPYIPQDLADAAHELALIARNNRLCLHQGVPLVPVGPWLLYLAYWLIISPLVIGFGLFNLPTLVAGYVASRTLPDAPNVVAFWRMAVGLPVGICWAAIVSLTLTLVAEPAWIAVYWAITATGIMAWYRFRKLSVALCNGMFRASAKPALLQAYRRLLNRVPHDRTA